jgi:hypothetical protein
MKQLSVSRHILLACLLLVPTASIAKDPTKPGPLQKAIVYLETARTAKEPLLSLRAARRSVVNAKTNKGGERKEAVIAIDQAIEATEAGDSKKMNAKIANAIFDIKQGMNNAK